MTDASCNLCGKTTDLMHCKKCKSVLYCTRECQVQDWPEHKTLCKRKEFAGAPCDVCHDSEQVIVEVCAECGFIFCRVCDKKMILRNDKGEKIGYGSCPSCEKPMMCMRIHDQDKKEKLENIIQERKGDTREAQWLVRLGYLYQQGEVNEPMAKQCYLRAAELGLGEGYCRLAEMHVEHGEWDEARRFYRKAAGRMHVTAIQVLGIEAQNGYFCYDDGQESPKRPPDLKEAFRLFREGASLGEVYCFVQLGRCFLFGLGTKVNVEKAFKWIQKGVEKGHTESMILYAQFYLGGLVVEKSTVQGKYWLDKALELSEQGSVESELAREILRDHNL